MEIDESLNLIKALADSSRLRIIDSLIEKPQYVEELAQRLGLAVSTVSFHLKKLEAAKLVCKTKEQYYVIFQINKDIFDLTLRELTTFENKEKFIEDERISSYKNKVLSVFFEGGKLLRMPVQYKKRQIVLEEILKKFEPGKEYPEAEVDALIEELYDDYCSVRRYFVDEAMMFRQKGIYRINPAYNAVNKAESVTGLKKTKSGLNKKKIEDIIYKEGKKMDSAKREELKRSYKLNPPPMGVYQVKNLISGNIFLGSNKNLNAIINRHQFTLRMGQHPIPEIQQTWNESEDKNLVFEIIDKLEFKDDPEYDYTEDLELLEEMWFEKLKSSCGEKLFRLWNIQIKEDKVKSK